MTLKSHYCQHCILSFRIAKSVVNIFQPSVVTNETDCPNNVSIGNICQLPHLTHVFFNCCRRRDYTREAHHISGLQFFICGL